MKEYVSEAGTFGLDRDFIFQKDHPNSRTIFLFVWRQRRSELNHIIFDNGGRN
jgi:hypothetical protein